MQWVVLFLQLDPTLGGSAGSFLYIPTLVPLVSREQVPEMYSEKPLSATTIKVSEVTDLPFGISHEHVGSR